MHVVDNDSDSHALVHHTRVDGPPNTATDTMAMAG